MPKRAAGLTVLGIKAATVGTHTDGHGLMLVVRSANAATFMLRYQIAGRRRDMGLGAARGPKAISLAKARSRAAELRALIADGIDPLEQRKRDDEARAAEVAAPPPVIHTFKEVAEAHIAAHRDGWRNPKHAAQWSSTLATHAYPTIGETPVEQIDVEAVLGVLKPIWTTTPETASRLRGRIEAILDSAKSRRWRSGENPAQWKGTLSTLLPPKSRIARVEHHPSLAWQQLPSFLKALRDEVGTASRALEFTILSAARTGEVREMKWAEVDLDEAVWTVPALRMKTKKLHRVPLSPQAVGLLKEMLPAKRTANSLVFEGRQRGVALSDMALSMLIRRMNGETVPPAWRMLAAVPRSRTVFDLPSEYGQARRPVIHERSSRQRSHIPLKIRSRRPISGPISWSDAGH